MPKCGWVNGTVKDAATAKAATGSASMTMPSPMRKSCAPSVLPGAAASRRVGPARRAARHPVGDETGAEDDGEPHGDRAPEVARLLIDDLGLGPVHQPRRIDDDLGRRQDLAGDGVDLVRHGVEEADRARRHWRRRRWCRGDAGAAPGGNERLQLADEVRAGGGILQRRDKLLQLGRRDCGGGRGGRGRGRGRLGARRNRRQRKNDDHSQRTPQRRRGQ